MMKKEIKRIISLVLVLVLSMTLYIPAFAGDSTSSGTSTVTVGGYTYTYYSYIMRWNEQLCARVSADANKTVPIGYMGTRARMYSENGALVQAADWKYNTMACSGFDTYVYVDVNPTAYYYSRGQVQFYNGSGYVTYTAKASPNMSLRTRSTYSPININENGELYGSEVFLDNGASLDLIYAIGENEIEGYVRAKDLESNSAEAPENVGQQVTKDREIPLYESDGETVIGTFIIHNNNQVAEMAVAQ